MQTALQGTPHSSQGRWIVCPRLSSLLVLWLVRAVSTQRYSQYKFHCLLCACWLMQAR
jgi:hypothetical protein